MDPSSVTQQQRPPSPRLPAHDVASTADVDVKPLPADGVGVSPAPATPPTTTTSTAHGVKLFVGGLSWQTTAAKLHEYFGVFGTVADTMIMRDPLTQRSRGFGFVSFADAKCVAQVLQLPTHILDGRLIDPKPATPPKQLHRPQSAVGQVPTIDNDTPACLATTNQAAMLCARSTDSPEGRRGTTKLFVGGISQDTGAEEIGRYFRQFGQVHDVIMPVDQCTGRHRGFGFVTFASSEIVDRLCYMHFHTVQGKQVECKRARPRNGGGGGGGGDGMARDSVATILKSDQLTSGKPRIVLDELCGLQMMANNATTSYGSLMGVPPPPPPSSSLAALGQQQQQLQRQRAAVAFHHQQSMAAAGGGVSALHHGFRYSPYMLPLIRGNGHPHADQHQLHQQVSANENSSNGGYMFSGAAAGNEIARNAGAAGSAMNAAPAAQQPMAERGATEHVAVSSMLGAATAYANYDWSSVYGMGATGLPF